MHFPVQANALDHVAAEGFQAATIVAQLDAGQAGDQAVALVGPLVKRLGERNALRLGLLAGALGFAVYGFAPNTTVYWLGLPVFALTGFIQPGLQGLMTRKVGATEQGGLCPDSSSTARRFPYACGS